MTRAPTAVLLLTCILLAWTTSGCGYVLVRVTATPDIPTPTSIVELDRPDLRATVTPIPSTPLPTSTATATPTPVVYVVQKGDNLLAIAIEYDISVESLMEANQIADPRALQIGQELIIPLDEEALLTVQPTATPTPMPLRIVNVAFHRTPVGSLWSMGEVQNDRDEHLEMVQLQALLYDVKGQLVGKASAFTATEVVPGHGTAPFALLFSETPAPSFASYEIAVLSAEPVTYWGRRHRTLVVETVEGTMDGGTFSVQGVLHNQSDTNAEEIRLTVTAYGDEGQVVGVRQVELPNLNAGGRNPFELTLIPAAPAVAIKAVAWGLKEASSGGNDIVGAHLAVVTQASQ